MSDGEEWADCQRMGSIPYRHFFIIDGLAFGGPYPYQHFEVLRDALETDGLEILGNACGDHIRVTIRIPAGILNLFGLAAAKKVSSHGEGRVRDKWTWRWEVSEAGELRRKLFVL